MQVSDINFTTTRIEALKQGKVLARATGFFYKESGHEYLITNRHVLIQEADGYYPESLTVLVHATRDNLQLNNIVTLNLYSNRRQRLWLEHPERSVLECDVVAIPMTSQVLSDDNFDLFGRSVVTNFVKDLTEGPNVNPFGDVVVVGYPRGFSDDLHNLPVYRKAMVASQYGISFRGKPYFLIDANLHPGTSGSPVVSSHHTLFKEDGQKEGYRLFGIFSAEHLVEGEPLGLHVVWYSSLIPGIVAGES
jgi:hypothetical protein